MALIASVDCQLIGENLPSSLSTGWLQWQI